jgi:hypothetical protein
LRKRDETWTSGLIGFRTNLQRFLPNWLQKRKAWHEARTMTHSIFIFLSRRALQLTTLFLAVAPFT